MSYIENTADNVESKYDVYDNDLNRVVRTKTGELVIAVTNDSIVNLKDKQ